MKFWKNFKYNFWNRLNKISEKSLNKILKSAKYNKLFCNEIEHFSDSSDEQESQVSEEDDNSEDQIDTLDMIHMRLNQLAPPTPIIQTF